MDYVESEYCRVIALYEFDALRSDTYSGRKTGEEVTSTRLGSPGSRSFGAALRCIVCSDLLEKVNTAADDIQVSPSRRPS